MMKLLGVLLASFLFLNVSAMPTPEEWHQGPYPGDLVAHVKAD